MMMNKRPSDISTMTDTEILARTIYGESRGEKIPGKEAVAAVIINRVNRAKKHGGRHWWGASIRDVCLKRWQFSCWNADDPNRVKLLEVQPYNRNFQSCLRIARRAVAGTLKDLTNGATHYHTKGLFPPWARGRMYAAEIGNHQFYINVE
jgi:N-acetylmuramoyl-L-alanine amidase